MVSNAVQFGLPLEKPSTQTILPIVEIVNDVTCRLHGFFPIPETEFDGTETTFALAEGNVNIQSVTLPEPRITQDYDQYNPPLIQQYMAATYSMDEAKNRPWIGYQAWIPNDDTGYFSWYSMPPGNWVNRYGEGGLVGSLRWDMTLTNLSGSSTPPTPPDGEDGTLTWVTTADITNQPDCPFFDFNWVKVFDVKPIPSGEEVPSGQIVPVSISIVSNPPTGEFKATISGMPMYMPGGGVLWDTIRIIRLKKVVAPGDYEFNFKLVAVQDGIETTTPVTLTLTAV